MRAGGGFRAHQSAISRVERANIEHRERRTRRKGNRPRPFRLGGIEREGRVRALRQCRPSRGRAAVSLAGVTLPGRGQRSASTRFCQNVGSDNGNWSR